MQWAQKQKGFTIVELLIVIVVIAILAAVTIVAYNGISNRAKESSVQSDVANAVKKLETLKVQSSTAQYPATLTLAGITASAGNTYDYEYSSNDNSYCLQSENADITWYASSVQTTPKAGTCGSDSLIGHWTFNGNTNDSSGNGLNGTSGGITSATGQNGQANGAYSFPGTAAYVTMGNSTQFNVPELTMSIWAQTNSTAVVQSLIAKEGKQKYRLIAPSGVGVLASNTSGWTHTPACALTYATGTWYHIVTTISSSTGRIKVYVNGAQICDQPGPTITSYTTNDLVVGSYNTGGAEGFSGLLDDARYYSRALTGSEVKGLYDLGAQ